MRDRNSKVSRWWEKITPIEYGIIAGLTAVVVLGALVTLFTPDG